MSEGVGRIFFAIGVDIEQELEGEFNEWYNSDHLPTVVACPGFVSGRRFTVDEGEGPRYWAVYEVESRRALTTPELQAIAGFGRFEAGISNQVVRWFTSLTPLVAHA